MAKKTKNNYVRVSCNFYDQLEIHAMHGDQLAITFNENEEQTITIHTIIKTLQTINGEEFLITIDGLQIRLDRITELNKT